MQRLDAIAFARGGALAAALLLAAAGCATTRNEDPDAAGSGTALAIEIQNDMVPPRLLTVTLVPETGTVRSLGIVSPSQTRTITVDPAPLFGRFRLRAETTDGSEILSDPFTLGDVRRVIWDLSPNSVRVVEDGAG